MARCASKSVSFAGVVLLILVLEFGSWSETKRCMLCCSTPRCHVCQDCLGDAAHGSHLPCSPLRHRVEGCMGQQIRCVPCGTLWPFSQQHGPVRHGLPHGSWCGASSESRHLFHLPLRAFLSCCSKVMLLCVAVVFRDNLTNPVCGSWSGYCRLPVALAGIRG